MDEETLKFITIGTRINEICSQHDNIQELLDDLVTKFYKFNQEVVEIKEVIRGYSQTKQKEKNDEL